MDILHSIFLHMVLVAKKQAKLFPGLFNCFRALARGLGNVLHCFVKQCDALCDTSHFECTYLSGQFKVCSTVIPLINVRWFKNLQKVKRPWHNSGFVSFSTFKPEWPFLEKHLGGLRSALQGWPELLCGFKQDLKGATIINC